MACSTEFIEFVCEVLSPLGEIRARKMMGDYILYLNEKCVATLCDNNVYVKIHSSINELMKDAEIGRPYEGAKDHYVLDISNKALAIKVISELWNHLPFPKKKGSSPKSSFFYSSFTKDLIFIEEGIYKTALTIYRLNYN